MAEDFVIRVDMQGQGPIDFSFQELSAGPHKVKIEAIEVSTEKKGSYRFTVSDQEEGSETFALTSMVVIGTDWTKKGNRGHLACLLAGMGLPLDKIKGVVEFKASQITGKGAYIMVIPPAEGELDDEGRKPFAAKNFITKEMYEAAKKTGAAMKARPKAAQAAPTNGTATPIPQGAASIPASSEAPPATGGAEFGNLFGGAGG